MANFDDAHYLRAVINLVDDPIEALANSVAIIACKLLRAHRPRIIGKFGNSSYDEPTVLLRR